MAYQPVKSKEHDGWYEIPGYTSCCANRKGEILIKSTGHITKGGKAGRYLRVSIRRDGSNDRILEYVHELVCRAFHGKPEKNQVVLHDNNRRFDNRPSNLYWGTQSKNIQDMYDDGLKPSQETYPSWLHWIC